MAVRRFTAVLSKTIRDRFSAVLIGIAEDSPTKVHCVLKGFLEFSHALSISHLVNRCSRYQLQPGLVCQQVEDSDVRFVDGRVIGHATDMNVHPAFGRFWHRSENLAHLQHVLKSKRR